ncbi:FtsK/SpoIIIE domain-containing protein [Mycobacterium intracellulare]|nr:FtsK/SpoIIIE domain-containing protein [Mycobacterium intracellulare]
MISVLAVLSGAWALSCYLPATSAIWCRLGMLAPAGERHLFTLPGAYPAVGWTTGTVLVDAGAIACAAAIGHAASKTHSQRITTDAGQPRTEWTFPSRRARGIYVIITGTALLAIGLGVGLQFGWGPTAAVPTVLLGACLLTSPVFQGSWGPGPGREELPGDNHKDLRRLHTLLKSRKDEATAVVVPGSVTYGSDRSPLSYKIRANTVGFFSTAEGQGLLKRLCTEMRGDEWTYTLQTGSDIAQFDRPEKKNFPEFAVPHPDMLWKVQSAQEATARYPDFKFSLGVDEFDREVAFSLKDFPHMALVGESGSGKSITLSTLVEFFLSAGWEIAIGDGKQVDYGPLRNRVVMVTRSDEEYARLIYWAWEEMQGRKTEMQERLDRRIPGSGDFPPLLALLDEFAAVYLRMKDRFSKEEFDSIMSKLSQLLKEGRQLRVHLIFATQTFRDSDFPRWILDLCPLRISLGPPNNITIKQAFQESVRDRAEYLGGKMKGKKGRGMVSIDDVPPERSLVEFQSWFGYSPATPDTVTRRLPDKVRQQHTYLKTYVSERVPKLYSRQWFKVDSFDDWKKPLDEICDIPSVSLDREDGTPDPAAYCYDPDHRNYNGKNTSGRRWGKQVKILAHNKDR